MSYANGLALKIGLSSVVGCSDLAYTELMQLLSYFFILVLFSHHLSMVGYWPSSSMSTDCVVSLGGDWAIFCYAGSGPGRVSSVINQGKIPWNTPPWLRIEPGPQGGQTVSYSTELSWPGPQGGQTVSYSTELSWLPYSCLFSQYSLYGVLESAPLYRVLESTLWLTGRLCYWNSGAN